MLTLITGGSKSGKSEYGESLVEACGDNTRVYIATMIPRGEETKNKIKRHIDMRARKQFFTIECFLALETIEIPDNSVILLECMSNLAANEMYEEGGAGDNTVEAIIKGVSHLCSQAKEVFIITNEVFSTGEDYQEEGTRYLKVLGEINCFLGQAADRVIEVTAGIPQVLKGTEYSNRKEEKTMELVLGGSFQGKLDYVLEKENLQSDEVIDGVVCKLIPENWKVIHHFEQLLRRLLIEGIEVEEFVDNMLELNPKITIICAEIGCGLVPIDDFERNYREVVGRMNCYLADKAVKVTRLVAGIPIILKEERGDLV